MPWRRSVADVDLQPFDARRAEALHGSHLPRRSSPEDTGLNETGDIFASGRA